MRELGERRIWWAGKKGKCNSGSRLIQVNVNINNFTTLANTKNRLESTNDCREVA